MFDMLNNFVVYKNVRRAHFPTCFMGSLATMLISTEGLPQGGHVHTASENYSGKLSYSNPFEAVNTHLHFLGFVTICDVRFE